MPRNAIILNDADNVATVVANLAQGDAIQTGMKTVTVIEGVPFGHKVALRPILQGTEVVKYGEVIGLALHNIAAGAWVHVHNVESQRGRGDIPDLQSQS